MNIVRLSTDSGSTQTKVFDSYHDINNAIRQNLLGVSALTGNVAIMCGSGGKLIYVTSYTTTATTTFPASGTTNCLNSVSAPSTTVAYSCGNSGTLIKTTTLSTSGGTQTSSATGITSTDTLYNVYFVNTNVGITVGQNNSGNPVAQHTLDGGANQTSITLPIGYNGGKLTKVVIVSTTESYILGNLSGTNFMFKTTSDLSLGSGTQSVVNIPNIEMAKTMDFPATNVGYLAGKNSVLYKTIDGGTNQTSLTQTSYEYNINSVEFFDANTGMVMGNNGLLNTITTGGTVSAAITVPYLKNINDSSNTSTSFRIAVGEDGGAWHTTNSGAGQTNFRVPFNFFNFECINFFDTNTGQMVGHAGRILKTTDGGLTQVDQSLSNNTQLTNITVISANDCYLISNYGAESRIYKTTNGGILQTQESLPGTPRYLRALYAYDASNIQAVGQNSTILYYNGTSQTSQTSPVTNIQFLDVHFFNATNGIAVGQNNTIIYTQNGGTNQYSITPNSGTYSSTTDMGFSVCKMIDATTAVVGGVSKMVKLTSLSTGGTAAGTTTELCKESNLLQDLDLNGTNMIVGGGKRMQKSSDSGDTQTELSFPTHQMQIGDLITACHLISATNYIFSYQSINGFDTF